MCRTMAATRGPGRRIRFACSCKYGNNPYDVKLAGYVNTTYRLPVGRGQAFAAGVSPWLNYIVGGWATSWVAIIDSGKYFSPGIKGFDTANTNTSFTQRPDIIGNPAMLLIGPSPTGSMARGRHSPFRVARSRIRSARLPALGST